MPDQNAPAKKHHSHHDPKERKHHTKPIDDLYYHLKKVNLKKGYNQKVAAEKAYQGSKKVMDKMESAFEHEMRKLEKWEVEFDEGALMKPNINKILKLNYVLYC